MTTTIVPAGLADQVARALDKLEHDPLGILRAEHVHGRRRDSLACPTARWLHRIVGRTDLAVTCCRVYLDDPAGDWPDITSDRLHRRWPRVSAFLLAFDDGLHDDLEDRPR